MSFALRVAPDWTLANVLTIYIESKCQDATCHTNYPDEEERQRLGYEMQNNPTVCPNG